MSIFTDSLEQVNNSAILTAEQKKAVKDLENTLAKADAALTTGIKTLKAQYQKPEQKPDFLRAQGGLLGDHAAYHAEVVAKIRTIQPTWVETMVDKARAGIEIADNVTTAGIAKSANGIGAAASPIMKQAGNFFGKLGNSMGKAFMDGVEAKS